MANKPKRKRKSKSKIKLKQSVGLRKKSDARNDTMQRMDAQMPRTTAPVLKVKIKKK